MTNFNFKAFAITSCLASVHAATTTTTLLRPSATTSRRLSFQKIVGYEPKSSVTDHAAIDLDLKQIGTNLAVATKDSYSIARAIYEGGAHSKSYADVKLATPLKTKIAKGAPLIGKNSAGAQVRGTALSDVDVGGASIQFVYAYGAQQATYSTCQVGALGDNGIATVMSGCLAVNGTIEAESIESLGSYTYDPMTENDNARTLQGFSTGAQEKMYECDNCPYVDYEKFVDYYGDFDYANKFVLAALSGGSTNFKNGLGNADFSKYTMVGRTEAVKKGIAYMNVFMYVIRELEDGLDDCKIECIDCNFNSVLAWDEAVAFYAGSLEGSDDAGLGGEFMFALSNKRCVNFKTCGATGDETSGTSSNNLAILQEFKTSQNYVNNGECEKARISKERIAKLMTVPLVQGTLRYAYITAYQSVAAEKEEAEGASFAAAVLPFVHACSEADAAVISENMRVGVAGGADFPAVLNAFQRNYKCMGITCADVGGLYNEGTKSYEKGFSPCGGKSGKAGVAVGATIGSLLGVGLLCFAFVALKRRSSSTAGKNSNTFASGVEQPTV